MSTPPGTGGRPAVSAMACGSSATPGSTSSSPPPAPGRSRCRRPYPHPGHHRPPRCRGKRDARCPLRPTPVTTATTPTCWTAGPSRCTTRLPECRGGSAPNWPPSSLVAAGYAALAHQVHLVLAAVVRRRPGPHPHRTAVDTAVPRPPGLVRADPAPHPEGLLRDPDAHPFRPPAAGAAHPPHRSRGRAVIWCRAGICFEDFEAHTGELAAACYAREARIERSKRWAQIVAVQHRAPRHPRRRAPSSPQTWHPTWCPRSATPAPPPNRAALFTGCPWATSPARGLPPPPVHGYRTEGSDLS